jgi:DNA-directed RNA polymerase subunit RPC12/RpoP
MKTAACKRCGKQFQPERRKLLKTMSMCCRACEFKNFFDGLDLPTPPNLLDRHTKHPTLTQAEWYDKFKEVKVWKDCDE